ncbi:MAG: hypothetical protein IH628_10235 [Proteobacteria bacterium]|nr:hypothetical protein [Pseudomonadota bacterium]
MSGRAGQFMQRAKPTRLRNPTTPTVDSTFVLIGYLQKTSQGSSPPWRR